MDFFVRTIPPTIKNRACTSNDAAVESAVALVRTDMLTNTSVTYESAMKQIKNDLEMTIPGLTE